MKQLAFTLEVLASREKLWECLWEKTAYSTWTAAFCDGSYYEGTFPNALANLKEITEA